MSKKKKFDDPRTIWEAKYNKLHAEVLLTEEGQYALIRSVDDWRSSERFDCPYEAVEQGANFLYFAKGLEIGRACR